ncbi:MAG: helix-turn-helix domain-containing protein [Tannerellaceae bacterium]|jgi:transcriptional regulator with XRE-family HTH domain|nr:helix-turn-helix domain-containing protein [Tannerellaceae bacterium]
MDLIEIGKQIRAKRKELNVDQITFAAMSHIGVAALGRLERGTGNPRFQVLHRVLQTAGLEITVK